MSAGAGHRGRRALRRDRRRRRSREPALGGGAPPARSRERVAVFSPLVRDAASRSASRRSTRATSCTSGRPRLFTPADRDTAMLLGDYLYAHGLVRVAAHGQRRRRRRPRRADLPVRPGTSRSTSRRRRRLDGDLRPASARARSTAPGMRSGATATSVRSTPPPARPPATGRSTRRSCCTSAASPDGLRTRLPLRPSDAVR